MRRTTPGSTDAVTRTRHYDELYTELSQIVAQHTTAYWRDWARAHSIASSEIETLEHLVEELPVAVHPVAGEYRSIPAPVRFSVSPQNIRRPAPLIGEHNRDVFREIGCTPEEIDALERCGALHGGPKVVA
ncbi:CoA transferase [Streptomyces sp. NPDC058382]|uniref:CoA transferase n=1 Tax=unclassified Streptomyces TaxID=2593676 RepID=UPI00363AAA7F